MKNIIVTAVIVILVATSSILGYFYADTSNELSSTKLQLNTANVQITSLQSELSTANAQVTSLGNQLSSANTQVTSLESQLVTANAQVTTLEGQLSSANTQVTSLQTELAIMQAKYPAKPFSSKSSLQNWVDLNIELIEEAVDATGNNAIWTAMVAVSNKAQEDGWIINACIDGQYFSLQAWVGNNEVYVISLGTAGLIVQVYP